MSNTFEERAAEVGPVRAARECMEYANLAGRADTAEAKAIAGLLAVTDSLGVALQTAYRIIPQFKNPQGPAEVSMRDLCSKAIKGHMPGFLDPHVIPSSK